METALDDIQEAVKKAREHWQDYKKSPSKEKAKKMSEFAGKANDIIMAELTNGRWSQELKVLVHDMKNPLTEIKGMADLLVDGLGNPDDAEMIEGSFKRMDESLDLVDPVLKKEDFKPMETDLRALIMEVVPEEAREDKPILLQGVEIRLDLEGLPQTAIVDPYKVVHTIGSNLVNNGIQAIKYAEGKKIENPFIHITGEKDDGYFVLHIRDNGPGIPEEVMDKLFKEQVTTKEDGSGIGLRAVKRAVEMHHGEGVDVLKEKHLWHEPAHEFVTRTTGKNVTREQEPGTVFHVRIPLKHELKP